MVAQTLRALPGSGLNVGTAMSCTGSDQIAWSGPSPHARLIHIKPLRDRPAARRLLRHGDLLPERDLPVAHHEERCGSHARSVAVTVYGNRAVATFVLGERPKHHCDGPGVKAAALFIVRGGKITLWEQIAVPKPNAGGPIA